MPSRYRVDTGLSGRADYTPNMSLPSRIMGEGASLVYMVPLLMLLPPAGLIVLWLRERYNFRMRIMLSVLSVASLAVIIMAINLSRIPDPLLPGPIVPTATPTAIPTATPTPTSQPTNDPAGIRATATPEPTQAPKQDTIVYSVVKNAMYYHAVKKCDGQTNRRSTTLAEAIALGLTPCPVCIPSG